MHQGAVQIDIYIYILKKCIALKLKNNTTLKMLTVCLIGLSLFHQSQAM